MDGEKVWALMESMQAEIAREIRVLLGEEALDQRIFSEADKVRRIEAMKKCAEEHTSDAERHDSWLKMHAEAGWVYGPKLDPANKIHPNMLPWDQLPASVRSKAKIFDIVSKYGKALAG